MQTILLADTGRQTTRLGFGCSSIMGSIGRRDSLSLLETAYDAGIRHFDVAPMYGFGQAEGCLGEFLARHPGELTVTTKFGIPPESPASAMAVARAFARPILKVIPGIKKRLQRVAASVSAPVAKVPFSPERAAESLARSLSLLRVERVDLLLLHEAEAADLNDDRLLRWLEDSIQSGTIGGFGIGSSPDKIPPLLAERPAYCQTLQYDWSVLDPLIPPGGPFRIHHRSLTENFSALREALLADLPRCKRWSEACDTDLASPGTLARLMLKAALVCNLGSVILFSSRRPGNILNNALLVDDATIEAQALQLYALVRTEIVLS